MALSETTAHILALFFTDVLLGIHLVTLGMALWAQCVRNPAQGRRTKWQLVCISLVMGTVGTFDAIIDVVLNIRVWTSMDLSLFNKGGWIRLMKNVDTVVPSILGDCMLIYRCWIVYDRRWKVIAPSFILGVAGIVLGITFVVLSGVLQSPLGVNNPALVPFVGAALALTVTVNLITTSLIVFRILQVDRGVRIFVTRNDKLVHFARIIIKSGLLYTLSAVITLCTGATTSNADYITSDAMVQIAGIAFNLIIIRFEKNLADQAAVELQFLASSTAAHTIPPLAGGDRVVDIAQTRKHNGLFDDTFGEEGNTPVCTGVSEGPRLVQLCSSFEGIPVDHCVGGCHQFTHRDRRTRCERSR